MKIKGIISVLGVLAIVLSGCSDRYDEGYDGGYDAGHGVGYLLGHDEGYAKSKPSIIIAPIPRQSTDITIQDLFAYQNLRLEVSVVGFSFRFSGEISNKTGADFSLAEFEIVLYSQNRATIDTERILISGFRSGSTRFFEELILTPIEEVHYYSITLIEG